MRITEQELADDERDHLTLVPETVDDLWHLQFVLEPGDHVIGETTRRIQRSDDTLRSTGGQREPMRVTLEVDEVEFHKFANRLRVGGVITDCSREDQLGLHHTLNIELFDEIELRKTLKPDQRDRLADAAEPKSPDIAVATIEEGLAHVHTVSAYGADEYASATGPTGKGEFARPRTELFEELTTILEHLEPDAIILAGPGFTKQDAFKHIEETNQELAERITIVDTSAVGDRGVHEVLKRGAVDEVIAQSRIAREAELIDELMKRIKQGEKAVFGPEEVGKAAEFGAVESLLILDERLRAERSSEGNWTVDANEIITTVEQQGGEIVVFSSEFDPGKQLDGLGGIAALLRYRIT